jgi:O-methyltransferase
MYVDNLELVANFGTTSGCIVECGVWRGGMMAGIAEVLGPNRQYFLFDSFEGLPPAREEVDGEWVMEWQSDTTSPIYFNNCRAAEEEAAAAMKLSGATSFWLVKGWFKDTLPSYKFPTEIAILRLDGDLYDSTRVCLENLYPHVVPGGIVILDDYHNWDGCARAVNEYIAGIASRNEVPRVREFHDKVAYLKKPGIPLSATNGSARQGA